MVLPRINYDFAGKYLLEANIRADASSRFAEGHRWGYFPSFSGAWRISEEAFMESAKDSWLSGLKIRASWGQLGNQDALSGSNNDYYPALNTYNLDSKYAFGGSFEFWLLSTEISSGNHFMGKSLYLGSRR